MALYTAAVWSPLISDVVVVKIIIKKKILTHTHIQQSPQRKKNVKEISAPPWAYEGKFSFYTLLINYFVNKTEFTFNKFKSMSSKEQFGFGVGAAIVIYLSK